MEKRKDENSGGLHKICVCVPGTAGISDSREKIWNQERILEKFYGRAASFAGVWRCGCVQHDFCHKRRAGSGRRGNPDWISDDSSWTYYKSAAYYFYG